MESRREEVSAAKRDSIRARWPIAQSAASSIPQLSPAFATRCGNASSRPLGENAVSTELAELEHTSAVASSPNFPSRLPCEAWNARRVQSRAATTSGANDSAEHKRDRHVAHQPLRGSATTTVVKQRTNCDNRYSSSGAKCLPLIRTPLSSSAASRRSAHQIACQSLRRPGRSRNTPLYQHNGARKSILRRP